MVRAVVTVLILIVIIAYSVFFLTWNAQDVAVYGIKWSADNGLWARVPMGLLLFGGVIVGAVAMVVALRGPWAGMKEEALAARGLVEKAKAKLKSQDQKIKKLTKQVDRLEAERAAEAGNVDLPEEVEAALDATEGDGAEPEGAPAEEDAPKEEKKGPEVDDPEVI